MRKGLKLLMAAALLLLACDPGPTLQAIAAVQETILFDQRRDACDGHDLPDAPARAFRNAEGRMVMFAPNFRNRAFEGRDLRSLKKDCEIRFVAGSANRPNLLDDRTWLHAFYTQNGQNVFALGSASFIPYRHGMPCQDDERQTGCWYNGLVALSSSDGGKTFHYLGQPPNHAVFPPPNAYNPELADPPGFISSTNFVTWKGHIYAILWKRGETPDHSGNCLVRAAEGNPLRWEMWTGSDFALAAELGPQGWETHNLDCAHIGRPRMLPLRGLVLHEPSETFIAVYQHPEGFFIVTSKDLRSWSMPRLLVPVERWTAEARAAAKASSRSIMSDEEQGYALYPSIIDDSSSDWNYGTIDDTADLIFVRIIPRFVHGKYQPVRQLVAIPITITSDDLG